MFLPKIVRWGGWVAILASSVWLVSEIVEIASGGTFGPAWALLTFSALILLPFGILGLYLAQVEETAWLGLAGTLFLMASCNIFAGFMIGLLMRQPSPSGQPLVEVTGTIVAQGGPVLAIQGLAGLMYVSGHLMFGIATIRAGVFPRGAGWLIVIGGPASPVMEVLNLGLAGSLLNVVAIAGVTWMGFTVGGAQERGIR